MSLASLKIIYTDQAQGGWMQSPLEVFFQNSEEVTFVTPFTPILNS